MRYDVTEMRPIGRRLWSAQVSIENPESIEGHDVFQNCQLHIRFSAAEAESAEKLAAKIHGEVERILIAALGAVYSESATNLHLALRQEADGWSTLGPASTAAPEATL
jgi:hypothetical protein